MYYKLVVSFIRNNVVETSCHQCIERHPIESKTESQTARVNKAAVMSIGFFRQLDVSQIRHSQHNRNTTQIRVNQELNQYIKIKVALHHLHSMQLPYF